MGRYDAYIQPDFARKQAEKQIERLNAVMQMLQNCHRMLDLVHGGEDAVLAQESIDQAYQHTRDILAFRRNQMPRALEASVAIDTEFDDDCLDLS